MFVLLPDDNDLGFAAILEALDIRGKGKMKNGKCKMEREIH
jgi:hypothetical protein